MRIHFDTNFQPVERRFSLKRGDDLELELVFLRADGLPYNPAFNSVVFAAKAQGDYSGEFLVYVDRFDAEADRIFRGRLQLNGEKLSALIGDESSVILSAEVSLGFTDGNASSVEPIALVVYNDFIKGVEGVVEPVPEYRSGLGVGYYGRHKSRRS